MNSKYYNQTLVDIVRSMANDSLITSYFGFYSGENLKNLFYADLDAEAKKIAALLQSYHMGGKRAILFIQPGLSYIKAFMGCLYASVIAVPCNMTLKLNERFMDIVSNADASCIIVCGENKHLANSPITVIDLMNHAFTPNDYRLVTPKKEDIAFLQYTSGSTFAPKGVIITHGNLISNLKAMHDRFQIATNEFGCSWLPPYHDMGLIGGILYPLYAQFTVFLMLPQNFIKKPLEWLEIISFHHVVISPAPNFAYDLCCQKVPDEATALLDLSNWRIAINGSDLVNINTLNRFYNKFKPSGFRYEAFYPTYGLAESTLLATGKNQPLDPIVIEKHHLFDFVSCGKVISEHDLKIIDPIKHTEMLPYEEGEIWLSGPSISGGYFNQTIDTFNNKVPNCPLNYMRTGDKGFVNLDNELFITGRYKEMLIIRGKNYHPQDLERVCYESHPKLIMNAAAIIQPNINLNEFIIVQEVNRYTNEFDCIYQAILQALFDSFLLKPSKIILIRQVSLPITSSGKIKRLETLKRYQNNELKVIHQWPNNIIMTQESLENGISIEWIKQWIKKNNQIDISDIGSHTLLSTLGFDSLLIANFVTELDEQFNCLLRIDEFYQFKTIGDLYFKLKESFLYKKTDCTFRLTPSFQEYSILKYSNEASKHFFNIPLMFRIKGRFNISLFKVALNKMILRHEILRVSYVQSESGLWERLISKSCDAPIEVIDLKANSKKNNQAILKSLASSFEQFSFNLNQAPLFKVLVVVLSNNDYYLIVTFSHLIVDGMSTFLFLSELVHIYNALIENKEPSLADAYPYSQFINRQYNHRLKAISHHLDLIYWKERVKHAVYLPVYKSLPKDNFQCNTIIKKIPFKTIRKLKELSQRLGVTTYSIFYATFAIWLYYIEQLPYVHFKSMHANRFNNHDFQTLGFLADGFFSVEEINNEMKIDDWIIYADGVIKEDISHSSVSFNDALSLLPEINRDLYPKFALSYNNYLKPLYLSDCKISLETKFFDDALMWGDTVNLALHVYQINDHLILRLRALNDIYPYDLLMEMHEKFNDLLNAISSGKNKFIKDISLQAVLCLN